MKKVDYEQLVEITVKTQEELDDIPSDFKGRVYIMFGTIFNPAIVTKRYAKSVEALGNSSVVARENSSVVALGNSQIVDILTGGRIEITGNARIVYMPKTIEEYCDFYGLKRDKETGYFYKCVHKTIDEKYFSDWDSNFEYCVGEQVVPDGFDEDCEEDCGHGIHAAHLAWALDYGSGWRDLAILEVKADLKDVLIAKYANGEVRCKQVKVIREVPLEECGVYGKILAKRRM